MIKFLAIIVVFVGSFNVMAQDPAAQPGLISRFRPGVMWFFTGYRPATAEKVRKYDRLIFDLTYNDWAGDRQPFNNKWNSIGFNTSLFFDFPLTKGNTISLGLGICHSLYRISYSYKQFQVDPVNDMTQLNDIQTFVPDLDKHFFCGNSLSIPVELRFRSPNWQHFKLHIGGKVGYTLNNYTKDVFDSSNGKIIVKNSQFPDVHRLLYSAHARIGFRNFALFGSYQFSPVFSNSASTRLNILQMGVSISLF
jgi:hypothetical protein